MENSQIVVATPYMHLVSLATLALEGTILELSSTTKENELFIKKDSIQWNVLREGSVFWVVREKPGNGNLKIRGIWKFTVNKLLPRLELAEVNTLFPNHFRKTLYIDNISLEEMMILYADQTKSMSYFDLDIMSILLFL